MVTLFCVAAALYPSADGVIQVKCNSSNPPSCPSGSNGAWVIAKDKKLLQDTSSPNQDIVFSDIQPEYKQLMVFRKGYKPAYMKDVMWTSSPVTLTMEKQIDLKIRFWAVCPDDAGDCSHPLTTDDTDFYKEFKTDANAVLRSERVGIRLVAADNQLFSDTVRTQSGATDFKNFGVEKCGEFNTWVKAAPGRSLDTAINIYIVSTVDGYSQRGVECSTNERKMVIIGATIAWETILHEIGHTLSLPDLPSEEIAWDGDVKENFMHGNSGIRKYFTEGEIFRIYVNDSSAVNTLFNPGHSITFSCGSSDDDAKTNVCPPLGKRIWSEF